MPRPSVFSGYPDSLRVDYSPTMGVVDRWVDPDSVVVQLDAAWDSYPCVSVRLDNFSSPDGHPVEAALMEFCEREFPPGTFLRVKSRKLPRSHNQPMTFTRYAASLESTNGDVGEILNAELQRLMAEPAQIQTKGTE